MVPIDDLLEKSVSQKEKFNEVNVLDIGCASGTWCLDMAKEFENVNFYGIDIGETFPKDIKFKNCNFKVGNIIKEFPFQENCFDFIHQRLLVAGIPSGNWVNVINNIKIGLKNDGWVELVEWDLDPFDVGPKFRELMDYGFDVLKDKNIDPSIAKKLKKLLESKNFKNINEICINVPINWDGKRKIIKKGKKIRNIYSEEKKIGELQEFLGELYVESEKIGYLHADDWKEIFKSLKKSIINKMNNPDNFDTLINDAIDECKNYNTYFKWYIIYGQINKIS
jgi:SAM-dependent methyltransferase